MNLIFGLVRQLELLGFFNLLFQSLENIARFCHLECLNNQFFKLTIPPCPAPWLSIFCLKNFFKKPLFYCGKIYIKFIILTILSVLSCGIKNVHVVLQPSNLPFLINACPCGGWGESPQWGLTFQYLPCPNKLRLLFISKSCQLKSTFSVSSFTKGEWLTFAYSLLEATFLPKGSKQRNLWWEWWWYYPTPNGGWSFTHKACNLCPGKGDEKLRTSPLSAVTVALRLSSPLPFYWDTDIPICLLVGGYFCVISAELSSCNRDCVAHQAYDIYFLSFSE